MKAVRLAVAAVLAAGLLVAATPALAINGECSGSTRPYQTHGEREQVLDWGWYVYYDTDRGIVGVYYSDGYIFADGSQAGQVRVRGHNPWHPGFVDYSVRVYTDGRAPEVCHDVKEFL